MKLDFVPIHLDLVSGHVVPIHMPSNKNCHSLPVNLMLTIYDLVAGDLALEYMVKEVLVQKLFNQHNTPNTNCNLYQMSW